MKRIIVALLAVLMVFGLASCNDNPNNVGLIIGNQTSSTKKATAVAEGIAPPAVGAAGLDIFAKQHASLLLLPCPVTGYAAPPDPPPPWRGSG